MPGATGGPPGNSDGKRTQYARVPPPGARPTPMRSGTPKPGAKRASIIASRQSSNDGPATQIEANAVSVTAMPPSGNSAKPAGASKPVGNPGPGGPDRGNGCVLRHVVVSPWDGEYE